MGLTQVSTDGVKNDAITKTKIPANQIEASELADNAVDTNAIADQAVALSKLPHGDSNNNGKFLRANNGADPTFETIDLTTLSASNLTSGTIPDARFPATLPAASAANLTAIPAANITGTLPAIDGSNLTGVMQADIDGLSWNTSNGVLTLQRHGLGNLTIDLDGRYPTGTIPTNNNQLSNGAGYMSGSTSQLCKAFVNYSGNNNSIRNDYNVSSITDHGTGDQTVNFSSSISMSYTVCGMPIAHDTGGTRCTNAIRGSSSSGPTRMNSTGVRINRGFGSHNAFADGHTMCVAIFRP